MGFTALHILLWLLTAFTLTTQELAKLDVTPKITAECGKQVTLNCKVTSHRNRLSVYHMKWSQNNKTLCSVDSIGNITRHHKHLQSDFHCEYKHGQLSLIIQKVKPLESGHSNDYMCKLRSNQGVPYEYTRLEFFGDCSLKTPKSGRNITSIVEPNPETLVKDIPTDLVRSGAESQGPMRTFLCISILLAVTLK